MRSDDLEIKFSEEAKTDIIDISTWYNKIDPSITVRFLEELKVISKEILHNPNSSPVIKQEIRRTLFRRFPFMAFYSIVKEENIILVLSIAHERRHPKNWVGKIR